MHLNFIKALKTGMLICILKRMGRYSRIQMILACTGLCQQRKNREQLSTIFSNFIGIKEYLAEEPSYLEINATLWTS